jgi:hypothetical protein
VQSKRDEIEKDKFGIVVTMDTEAFNKAAQVGVSTSVNVHIKSTQAHVTHRLVAVHFLNTRAEFSSSPTGRSLSVPISMGEEVVVTVTCKPKSQGTIRNVLALHFEGQPDGVDEIFSFGIGRYIEFRVGSQQIFDLLKPVSPYKRKKRNRTTRPPDSESIVVVDGQKIAMAGNATPWAQPLGFYNHAQSREFKDEFQLGVVDEALEAMHEAMHEPAGHQGSDTSSMEHEAYARFFHTLLYCEEHQQHQDIRFFDMEGAILTRGSGGCLVLRVPGLAEKRPSVLTGDVVKVRLADQPGRVFKGYAHRIDLDSVHLKFHQSLHERYIANQKVNVEFTINRTPARIFHQGIEFMGEAGGISRKVIFPDPCHVDSSSSGSNVDVSCVLSPPSQRWFAERENQFNAQWLHPEVADKPRGRVLAVLRVEMKHSIADRFEQYQASVCRDMGTDSTHSSLDDGSNTRRRFHGTFMHHNCKLGSGSMQAHGTGEPFATPALCSPDMGCGVCGVIQNGFDTNLVGKNTKGKRFGHGIYSTATSSKAHDYTAFDREPRPDGIRAVFIVKAVAGNPFQVGVFVCE